MILVDSSVWINYFRGDATPQTERLDALLGAEPLLTGDIILAEVLQGFTSDRAFNVALRLMGLSTRSISEVVTSQSRRPETFRPCAERGLPFARQSIR